MSAIYLLLKHYGFPPQSRRVGRMGLLARAKRDFVNVAVATFGEQPSGHFSLAPKIQFDALHLSSLAPRHSHFRTGGIFILCVNLWRYFHLIGSPILTLWGQSQSKSLFLQPRHSHVMRKPTGKKNRTKKKKEEQQGRRQTNKRGKKRKEKKERRG